ncbi:NAD(P)-binding domain-containing protein [Mesobacillus harenae]|uniref:NAD(P)-binding domain-containing protein n=1 Tax=Mesobacillus harenae TaxID=2213203 RepID=UPI00157FF3A4
MLDVAIIGAGPYGISMAAHAKKAGLHYRVFGYPMEFWHSKMPPNMYIRTLLEHTGLSDPDNQFTLKNYQSERNINLTYPMPRSVLVEYANWFINKTKISVENSYITKVLKSKNFFVLETDNGTTLRAKNVIIAVGLTNAKYIPENFKQFSKSYISHTADHTDYRSFKDKSVLVLGGGQSAWEAAALLYQAGAEVELVYRRPQRLSPDKNTNAIQKELAGKFYFLSYQEKEEIRRQLERPTVSDFLIPLVEGKVTQRPNTMIDQVFLTENQQLLVSFNDQSSAVYDHVIAATGYRFSVNKLFFLQSFVNYMQINEQGEPKLNEYFESSIPNLYFAGPAAAYSHGPTFRFISGVWKTSEVTINHISRQSSKRSIE